MTSLDRNSLYTAAVSGGVYAAINKYRFPQSTIQDLAVDGAVQGASTLLGEMAGTYLNEYMLLPRDLADPLLTGAISAAMEKFVFDGEISVANVLQSIGSAVVATKGVPMVESFLMPGMGQVSGRTLEFRRDLAPSIRNHHF